VSVKRGIFLPPFDELVDPRTLVELAELAEERGWDGFFLWDHIAYRAPVRALADPWIALAAIASATEKLRLGPLVTPLPRRRVQKVARETVTLDRLSGGRLTLGVGIGGAENIELEPFGEEVDPRKRARLLDERLKRLTELWGGEFEPPPVQQPRIPIWVAARWPNRRPVRRAARWDGLFLIDQDGPDDLEELANEVRELRAGNDEPFDLVVEIPFGADAAPWEAAGATWVLADSGTLSPRLAEVREAIEAGPGGT
jgi:alkanesulfonate monooxygenase SsuD/methylene tetrahydromethanopterin reductase-like flavin-dependent oxidoreductase (luciferase family)